MLDVFSGKHLDYIGLSEGLPEALLLGYQRDVRRLLVKLKQRRDDPKIVLSVSRTEPFEPFDNVRIRIIL